MMRVTFKGEQMCPVCRVTCKVHQREINQTWIKTLSIPGSIDTMSEHTLNMGDYLLSKVSQRAVEVIFFYDVSHFYLDLSKEVYIVSQLNADIMSRGGKLQQNRESKVSLFDSYIWDSHRYRK